MTWKIVPYNLRFYEISVEFIIFGLQNTASNFGISAIMDGIRHYGRVRDVS